MKPLAPQPVKYRGTVTGLLLSAVDGTAFIDNASLTVLPENGKQVVAPTAIAAAAALLDTTTASAFYGGAVDLTAYQTGNYAVRFKNTGANNAEAIAYISATAPSGLDGTDLIGGANPALNNGNFASDEPPGAVWTRESGWTVTGGVATNTSIPSLIYQNIAGTIAGALIYRSWDLTARTAGSTRAYITNGISPDYTPYQSVVATYSGYVTISSGSNTILGFVTSASPNLSIDNVTFKRITMPAATGALLLSTKAGSRGWYRKDTAFDPNAAMTYEILDVSLSAFTDGNHSIEIYSGALMDRGVMKAVGTGETLDATNVVASWTNGTYGTFTSEASPDIAAAVCAAAGTAASNAGVTAVGKMYKLVATWTNVSGQAPTLTGTNGFPTTVLAAGANNIYFTATGTSVTLTVTNTAAASWGCTFVLKQVTVPSASGATIVTAKAGTTYNFNYKHASFTYNAASYTVLVKLLRG